MNDGQRLPPPVWVDTPARLGSMLRRLEGEPRLAVDTESNSLYAYHERLCLIQISIPGVDYLVDPLALHDLSGLNPFLADPAVLKVLHGAEYDLSVLQRDLGCTVRNLFDTMWASRILGWPAHGLAALLEQHFGVSVNKKYQRANWGVRPLPPEQLDYARLDSHYLLPLYEIQAQALSAAGRWPQARHRFQLVSQTRWESRPFDPEGYWRLPGAGDLDDVGRGVLRALYLLREQCAEAADCPPFKAISNQTLLRLSELRPHSLEELRRARGVSKRCLSQHGKALLAAIREGERRPIRRSERRPAPHHHPNGNGRPTAECRARFEALRAWRNAFAERRGVEPDIILNNETLWAVAHRNPRQSSDLSQGGLLAPWQVDEFGEELLAVVTGGRR